MYKVLIYINKSLLQRGGGPSGYNYNLNNGLESFAHSDIEINYLEGKDYTHKINNMIKNISWDRLRNILIIVKSVLKKGKVLYGINHKTWIDVSDYDAIHFHSTMDLYNVKDSLKKFEGKVLLTSHTPTMPCKEIWDNLSGFEKKHMKWFYKKFMQVDKYAFNHADYIIFPCKDAEEPYYHEWPNYESVHNENKDKYLYLPTGTPEITIKMSREQIRKKYNIPEDAFIVSYVGRHNEIKGYSNLKRIAEILFENYNDIYFLIAGKEEPLKRLDHPHWIEIGWTNDVASIINCADLFILPNKETYFDLILIEVLSLGQIVLASDTGGNKYFSKFDNSGIYLYSTIEDALKKIIDVKHLDEEFKTIKRKENKKIYLNNFTTKLFASNYIEILTHILKTEIDENYK